MKTRTLGTQGLTVSELGLGCMGMTYAYGSGDEQESIAVIHRAIELGITLLDTAEIYGPFTNEQLVGRAIQSKRDRVVIATKFGFGMSGRNDCDPNIRRFLLQSFRDCPDCKLGCTIYRSRGKNGVSSDRGQIHKLPEVLLEGGQAAATPCRTPRIFTSIIRFYSSTFSLESGIKPALLTITSMRPNLSLAKSTKACMSSRLVTSKAR